MNLNFYAKTMNLLVSLKKTMVLSIVTILFVGSASAQLSAGALNFDGINDIVNVPLKPELNISKAITIEAWINPTVANVGTRKTEDVISKSTSSINNGYIFPRTSSGWKTIEFILYINGYGWKALTVPYGTDKLGQWHHLAATYDGVKMVIYIDGVQAGQFAFAGTITTNNNPLTIGNQPGYNENYEGAVDEARIWSRALPQCEIANNMSCELSGLQNGLAAYYKFNQGLINAVNPLETSLIDSSPTGANGTLTNFGLLGLLSNWSAGRVSGTCTVFTSPNVTATADQTLIPIGGTIQLHATGGDTYSWTGPNGFTSTDPNPVITGAPTSASGNYTVVATTGGCTGTATVNVTVALMASGLNFDGVTNSITVPYNAGILNTNAFTIESWIYPTSSNTIIQDVVSNTVFRGTSGVRFPKTNDRWTTFSFDLYINGELKTLTANFPSQALGQWNHLAATYDGYYMRVYLNGIIAGTLEVYGTVDSNTNNFTIGNQEGRGEFFKGTVDELRIWSRALSQCEIINNMQTCELNGDNNGIAQQSGLAAYYRFNQGLIGVNNASYNILADSSGHGNNGTLNNFALNGSSSNWVDGKVYGICAYFPPPLLAASANGSAFQTGSDAKLFAVGGNNAYAWTGPSSFQSYAQNPVLTNVQPSNSGTYTVTADYVSCVVTASTRFNVGNVSPIIADGPTAICPSGSVGLSIPDAGSTATYQWFKNGVAISGATAFQYVATQAGNYTVTTTNGTDVIVSATTTVTIVPDVTAPVADAALSAVNILVGGTVTAIPTATDNCRGVVNGTANRSLTFNTPGTFTITWTYDDLNGNRSTQTQTVNVIDNIAPVLSVPANISVVGTTGICSAVVGFAATATDNSGGAVTITYSQNPNTAFAVGATTVTVTATDASNNSSTGSFIVTVTPPAVAPITGNTTICAGGSSALASATAGGTWSSDNIAVATINPSGVVTAQSLGTANITYTDACGSSVTTIVTVSAIPSTPNISVADNCGSSVLTTDATGTLLWSTNATTSSITVSTAGTYTVTQNLNGCTSAAGSAVAAPIAAPAVPSVSVTQPTCAVSTGTLVVNSPAGLSYSIDGINYQSGNTFSGLASGSYTVSVKNGICVTTSANPIVINAQPVIPAAPVASVSLQPSCSVATGTIVVSSPSGFTYSLDGVTYQSGSTFTGVAPGTYTLYAKNGTCVSAGSSPVTVNAQPAIPSAPAVSVTQPTCAVSTGTIVVTAPAGLSYSLDGITYQPGTTFTGVATGSYTIYVSNGTCITTSTSPVVINAQPVTPAAPVVSVTAQPSCSVATGTIVISSPSGFTYSLDGVTYQSGTTFSAVAAGTYTLYAKNGTCVSAGSSPVTVNAQPVTPAAPVVSVTAQPTCSVATGTIVVSSPSGFTYSLNGGTYQTSTTFSGVAAGTYTVTAKNGSCVSTVSNAVTVNAQPVTPAAPVVSVTAQPTCSVATGTIVVSSPSGFTYSLDGITYQSGTTFTGVAAGTYTVSAKSGSCVSSLSNSVTVNAQPAAPTAPVVSITQPTCTVATASISISSPVGTGLTYSIDGTNYQAGTSFTGLTANRTYTVYVKNAAACVASASAVIIAQPATPVVADITGTTNFAVGATSTLSSITTGGVWSSSNTAVATVNASGVVTGVSIGSATITYTVTTGGCSSSKSAAVTIVSACVTPVFTTITNINTTTVSGCTAPVSYTVSVTGNPTLSYTFAGATVASGSGTGSGASFNTGQTTVTVKAVNACATVTTSFIVTVRDATPPSAITKNISVALDGNGQVTIAPSQVDNGSSDNCGTVTLAFRTGASTSVTTGTICGTADENGNLVLTAPAGGVITSINFASYGTPTGTCGSFVLGACNASTSKTVVEGYALGKNSVTIPANNSVFGDPCVGTYKRLYVQATYQITVSVNANTTASTLSFGCANKGANTVTLNVTDAAGNVSTQTAIVTVVDNTAPSITTVVPNQSFCGAAGNYTIPSLVATDNCAATVTYSISGATTRSGSGSNASGTFNTGTSVISWTVTDGTNTTSSSTTVTVGTTPAGTIIASNADAFCNKLVLTGSSAAVNAAYKWVSPTGSITNNAQLSLGSGDADGVYQLIVTSNGCASAATTYNYQKQNTISNYAILGFTQIQLGSNNTVGSGGIGVTSPWGYIGLSSYTNISSPGSFVKAANIGAWGWGINIANPIWSAATGITLPTMYYNTTGKADGNPSYTVNNGVTTTLNGNYKNLTLKKGSTTVLNGTVFGSITVEQGAQVTFTAATVNIDKLKINKGPRYGYTYVRFSQDAKVLISTNVTVSSNCFINPDNNNVTFYLGDASPDTEKFTVTGGDTKINANVYVPKGILKVTGGYRYGDYGGGYGDCDRDDDDDRYYGQGNSTLYMTGFYIADQVVGYGKNVTWNTFDCSAAPVTVASNSVQQSTNASATKETAVTTTTSDEELKVTVMPNPSTTYFTLKFESKYETPVNMRVMDASGRVVDAKSKIGSNSTIQIGANYVSGTYYAEMIQGTQRKVVQLMKVK